MTDKEGGTDTTTETPDATTTIISDPEERPLKPTLPTGTPGCTTLKDTTSTSRRWTRSQAVLNSIRSRLS